jgi:ribonuclease PH
MSMSSRALSYRRVAAHVRHHAVKVGGIWDTCYTGACSAGAGLPMKRVDGRANDELRPVSISLGYQAFAEGSALIELGRTRVLCAVSVEDRVPPFLKGEGTGWVTAEYAMLPRSTLTRTPRSTSVERTAGRNQEIQRLIGRSLRAVTNLSVLGERTFTVDCDVLQADGGTRTAAITGGYVALFHALNNLKRRGVFSSIPLKGGVAATSVGIVDREELLDLCYEEDFRAAVDFNVVMTDKGEFVEIQGTAEGKPFSREAVDALLSLSEKGIKHLFKIQKEALAQLR